MKSVEEKKLAGTYRKDRDAARDKRLPGEKIEKLNPPAHFKKWPPIVRESFESITAKLCGLKLLEIMDAPTIYNAFDMLAEAHFLAEEAEKAKEGAFTKPSLIETEDGQIVDPREVFQKLYDKLLTKRIRCLSFYEDTMAKFFVSPKERVRVLALINPEGRDGNDKKAPIDRLLSK